MSRILRSINFVPFAVLQFTCFLLAACNSSSTLPSASMERTPSLGMPVSQSRLSELDLIIAPDGSGLPVGSGTAAQGESVYRGRCQSCHGENGEGRSAASALTGGSMQSAERPLRTVGSYWPHATTVFDFIRRAMPADAPKSLTNEEVYQVTAYVLFLNGLVERNQVLDAGSLPTVRMPNQEGFIDRSHLQ